MILDENCWFGSSSTAILIRQATQATWWIGCEVRLKISNLKKERKSSLRWSLIRFVRYVEIIHTSSTWLGLSEPIGTTNFYPNHGKSQLGCRLDPTGTCSHLRAYKYFAESIYSNVSFYGYPCDTLDDMKESKCKGVGARMGGEPGNYRTWVKNIRCIDFCSLFRVDDDCSQEIIF